MQSLNPLTKGRTPHRGQLLPDFNYIFKHLKMYRLYHLCLTKLAFVLGYFCCKCTKNRSRIMFLLRQAEMIEAVRHFAPTTGALKLSCKETSIEE